MKEDLILEKYINTKEFREGLSIPFDKKLELKSLAQGEYHKNYVFTHPVSLKKLVLRVNYGSQMHLDNQIEYEYNALKLIENSKRTAKPLYVDGSGRYISQGILVMEYLEGRPLDYRKDLNQAAKALADIHSSPVADATKLIEIKSPIYGILEECEEMFGVYKKSPHSDPYKIERITKLMKLAYERAAMLKESAYDKVCINTELNNCNFIVNEDTGYVHVIDWEKPLYGDPAQDLGHMLAPTTSFWKTDIILSEGEMEQFMKDYIKAVDGRINLGNFEERLKIFIPVTCLRGITWCAMAWHEYNEPGRELNNPYTYEKLKAYLSDEYLDRIEAFVTL